MNKKKNSKHHLKIIKKIKNEKKWVENRCSENLIFKKLQIWEKKLLELGEQNNLKIQPEEIYSHFYMSYFRTIDSERYKDRLKAQLMNSIMNIKKDRLFIKFKLNETFKSDNKRWKEFKYERLEKRFTLWKSVIKEKLPEISDDDVFKFFKKRYIQVDEKHFIEKEVPIGIKNTENFLNKKEKLQQIYILNSHPQFEQYITMPHWEFKRKINSLETAIKLAKENKLNFPLIKNSINKRIFYKHLRNYQRNQWPNSGEENLYKLIIHFNGVTQTQIENIFSDNKVNIGSTLEKLINLELIEEQEFGDQLFYTKIGEETQKELIVENWLKNLRKNINIGTGEALSYFGNYQDYSNKTLEDDILPQTTIKIYDDRRKYLEQMGIDIEDSRYKSFLKHKKTELQEKTQIFQTIINEFKEDNIKIPQKYEDRISDYDYMKDKDIKVFWLIYHLEETSQSQLSNIYKNLNNGKIGFKLKSSLKRLFAYGLIKEERNLLYVN